MQDREEGVALYHGDNGNGTDHNGEDGELESNRRVTAIVAGSLLLVVIVALMLITVLRDKNRQNTEAQEHVANKTKRLDDKPPSYEEFAKTKDDQDDCLPTYREAILLQDAKALTTTDLCASSYSKTSKSVFVISLGSDNNTQVSA